MTDILYHLLMCTVSGSIMFMLAAAVHIIISKKTVAVWYYSLLVMSLAMFLIPLQSFFSLPRFFTVRLASDLESIEFMSPVTELTSIEAAPAEGINVIGIIFCVWLAGFAAMLLYSVIGYIRVGCTLRKKCRPVNDKEVRETFGYICYVLGIKRSIRLCRRSGITSPVLFGIIHPTVIIPDSDFSEEELTMIFTHELTHYRHCDLYIKLASVLCRSVHWFNPVSHIICRAVIDACEACCDETVLYMLKLKDCKDYGRLLLSVIDGKKHSMSLYSTSMASSKKYIKKRLIKIAGFKEATNVLKIMGVLSAAAIAVCSLSAFGITRAAAVVPTDIAPIFENAAATARPEPTPQAELEASAAPQQSAAPSAAPVQTAAPEQTAEIAALEPEYTEAAYAEAVNAEYLFNEADDNTTAAANTPEPEEIEWNAMPSPEPEEIEWNVQPLPEPSGVEPVRTISEDVIGTSGYIERGTFGENGLVHGSYVYSDEQNTGAIAVLSDITRLDILRYDEELGTDVVVFSFGESDLNPWGMPDKSFAMEPGVMYSYILHGTPEEEARVYLYAAGPAKIRPLPTELEYDTEQEG